MSVFKKCNLKIPNIDFVFCCSKTPLHVTNSCFFPSVFFKTCPFLHPSARNPRFNYSPFLIGTPVLTFLWQKTYNFSLAKNKIFLNSVLEISLFAIFDPSMVNNFTHTESIWIIYMLKYVKQASICTLLYDKMHDFKIVYDHQVFGYVMQCFGLCSVLWCVISSM